MSTKRVRLVVAYDGTDFCGWAAQNGRRTVQRTLKDAVRQVSGEDCEIIGASRTDSGAHAKGQVCHFDSAVDIEPHRWQRVLNKVLPRDVSIVSSTWVRPDFHSRFSARDRYYRYRILIGQRDALRARFTHEYWKELDVDLMNQCASSLIGKNDFLAFSEELEPGANSWREIYSIKVARRRDEVHVDVVGTAFLRGMMRRISGGLLEVGRGKRSASQFTDLLDYARRQYVQWPEVLPARGLTLMRVRYGRHPIDNRKISENE